MKRTRKKTGLVAVLLFVTQLLMAQSAARVELDFNKGWKFLLGNNSLAIKPGYNDSKWRLLNLPHDWSIESNFIKDAPATNQGGSLPCGIGWYRKTFTIPVSDKSKTIRIAFDGVYKNSEVWINGHYLGKRPNGYVSFSYELTEHLYFGKSNTIVVKVDNSQQPDSRWYSGSGIYRDVKLIKTNRTAVKENGLYISTSINEKAVANINIQTVITDPGKTGAGFEVKQEILDAKGKLLPDKNYHSNVSMKLQGSETRHLITMRINNPVLWDVSNPYLYTLRTRLFVKGVMVDEVITKFGIRSFRFDAENGFFLNERLLKIKGVCMHHDLGALGAVYNNAAGKRQLSILKQMGCNAIRFSHNPPSSALLDLCDEMGFLVIDEAFDMWKKKKNKYDYHLHFGEWHERDLTAMILRDRNHPSVFMWSIGNEIREQFDSSGIIITQQLVALAKQLDPTRPVISAMTETNPKYNYIAKSGALDVFGFNYKDFDYDSLPVRFPGQKFLATETASSLATRGVYQFPSDSVQTWPPDYKHQDNFDGGNPDYTTPAYDNTKAYWGGLHEKTWLSVKKRPFIAGGFVWSGFDYIGEPLPYPKFPARSSYFGIIDLAGFPKDVYYMYQSEWTDKPVLHLFPHWNWKQGDTVDVWAYYSQADEVELFVNNKSVGKRSKTDSVLHVMWRVPYQPGSIKVISRKNGETVLSKEIKTAGKPYRIELTADKKSLKADGKDLCFVTVKVLDARGNIVPDAGHLVRFSVSGSGTIAGTDNGYQADSLSLKSKQRNCWKGMALVIVQSGEKKGNITLKADSAGLLPAVISLKTGE